MGAALALLVLLAGSVFIVRVASVFLRLTGLPDHVARFQSVSALTGAGFTTTESESIVNYPIRRRVIVGLMILGNVGLVSVASTFIVALASSTDSRTELLQQIGLLLAVSILIAVFMVNKTFDRILCGLIEKAMRRLISGEIEPFESLLKLPGDRLVANHRNRGSDPILVSRSEVEECQLKILHSPEDDVDDQANSPPHHSIAPGESLICLGMIGAHASLSDLIRQKQSAVKASAGSGQSNR